MKIEVEKLINKIDSKLSKATKKYVIKTIKQCKNKNDLDFIAWLGGNTFNNYK
jgi:hypothetical protein